MGVSPGWVRQGGDSDANGAESREQQCVGKKLSGLSMASSTFAPNDGDPETEKPDGAGHNVAGHQDLENKMGRQDQFSLPYWTFWSSGKVA
jgi:hypothetical protein